MTDEAFSKWWDEWGVQYTTTAAAAEQAFQAAWRHAYAIGYSDGSKDTAASMATTQCFGTIPKQD